MKASALVLASLFLIASWPSPGQGAIKTTLTESQTKALRQAIQDEIYDYEYEGYFFPEGGPVGEAVSASRTRVDLYINPSIEDGEGEAVYKLMPYGEVFRLFHVHGDGMIVLDGDPEIGFPATQVNRKTVYFKDSTISRMKHDWVKSSFVIDLDPRQERVQDAVRRQKQRTGGFSAWEFARSKEGKKPR
jgi:hypothetical protein